MDDFDQVFNDLKKIMLPYARKLICKTDSERELYVDTEYFLKNKKPLWFGAVQIKKNYVSYHLMPVYLNPALLEGISSELKKRMQGKSCFNFRTPDHELFEELAALTESGYSDYKRRGYIADVA